MRLLTCLLVLASCHRYPVGPMTDRQCLPLRVIGKAPHRSVVLPAPDFGGDAFVQLDTGADASVLYGAPPSISTSSASSLSVLGGPKILPSYRPDLATEDIGRHLGRGARLVGTVGTDMLAGRTLAFFPERDLLCDTSESEGQVVLPSHFRNGKVFVDLSVGAVRLGDVAFDTGAQFGLVVDASDFEALTGRPATDPTNRRLSVSAWGESIDVATAPTRDEVRLGTSTLGILEVATMVAKPTLFESVKRFRLRGLLGWPALARRSFTIAFK